MKILLFFVGAYIVTLSTFAQGSAIQWQKTFGGTAADQAKSILQTTDGGFITVGNTSSNDGSVTGNHGLGDIWVVKLNANGTQQWQKTLGGSGNDYATSIQQTTDGGYVIAGYTESNDGDVTGNHGGCDFWVVKLSFSGIKQWQKTFGGSSSDWAGSIQQTTDGGYIVAGSSYSVDGDVTGNYGFQDFWLVKLNSTGVLEWQKNLGGSRNEYATSILQTTDGGYVIAGHTDSNDIDVIGNHGGYDFWIVKLNSIGVMQWQQTLGGSGDDYATSIQQTTDGGYVIAGYTLSNDGDVTGNHGRYDCWVVKLTDSGIKQWQRTFGGSLWDWAESIQETTDGGYIVAGSTSSVDGDVTVNHGIRDFWLVKLNSTGVLEWQKTLGGSGTEAAASIQQTTDGGYVIAGFTMSNDGDVSGYQGNNDIWVVKLSAEVDLPTSYSQTFCDKANVNSLEAFGSNLQWYELQTGGTPLDTNSILTTGTYYVSQTVGGVQSARTAVTVTINATLPLMATAQIFNYGSTIADLVATGINLQWYNSINGGVALTSNTILVSGNYYVSQTLNNCESKRTLVDVTIIDAGIQIVTPFFEANAPICIGENLISLPISSVNGIIGNWSPALNVAATTTYTFTPNPGQNARIAQMTIWVNPLITPNFCVNSSICLGETLPALPTT